MVLAKMNLRLCGRSWWREAGGVWLPSPQPIAFKSAPWAVQGRGRLSAARSRACAVPPRQRGDPVFRDFRPSGGKPGGRGRGGGKRGGQAMVLIGQLEARWWKRRRPLWRAVEFHSFIHSLNGLIHQLSLRVRHVRRWHSEMSRTWSLSSRSPRFC